MRCLFSIMAFLLAIATQAISAEKWYAGDERCPPPEVTSAYSAPYNALDHPNEYPVFADADKHGWSCSYQNENGVTIQYGDSRTPQEQWLAIWGDSASGNAN